MSAAINLVHGISFSFSFVFWVWLKESDYIRKTEQPQQAASGEEETEA